VAWRKRDLEPPRIEPPLWYRVYDPAAWDEPDGHEQRMMDGSGAAAAMWPAELHEIHARRRWQEAKYRYRREHSALATQEFDDLVGEEARARRAERRGGWPA
jgi:hypothetical protein